MTNQKTGIASRAASDRAFEIGQATTRTLLRRAKQLAVLSSGDYDNVNVSPQHVDAAFDEQLLEAVRLELEIRSDARPSAA